MCTLLHTNTFFRFCVINYSHTATHHNTLHMRHAAPRCNTPQLTATLCTALRNTAPHFNSVVQCSTVCCRVLRRVVIRYGKPHCASVRRNVATHAQCGFPVRRNVAAPHTLHHIPNTTVQYVNYLHCVLHCAQHCNTYPYRIRTNCSTLQHTVLHCTTLQHTATHCATLYCTATICNTSQHAVPRAATHCDTLQHCNILQHAATHLQQIATRCATCRNTLRHIATS